MAGVYRKISSALKAAWDYIPNPLHWVFGEPWPDFDTEEGPETDCEFCKEDNKLWEELPDDLREYKPEKEFKYYNLKLDLIKPRHWKELGRNLMNMAYRDPNYADSEELDTEEEDLPPIEEPSDKVKALELPVISVNLKYQTCHNLEELGDYFYDCADFLEASLKGERWPGYPKLPSDKSEPDYIYEEVDKIKFDPVKKVFEELTEIKRLTLSDFITDMPKVPYRDDADELFDYKMAYPNLEVDPLILKTEEAGRDLPCKEDTWMTHLTEDPFRVPDNFPPIKD